MRLIGIIWNFSSGQWSAWWRYDESKGKVEWCSGTNRTTPECLSNGVQRVSWPERRMPTGCHALPFIFFIFVFVLIMTPTIGKPGASIDDSREFEAV